ncbi:dermonecrotic toxin domain-containing protein [Pseudomonas sp. FP2338]|uniref:dermonecrotic toxin domain-containing protein n=1 Tax=Pseudomonas sp. FP2338 TaxID=2954093 RepID=UPI002734648E|nr:DUF6543 domain-containing protein [Pseudomonas sp. FP2338]WLH87377.1 hypothetical protein PSH96_13285 [Pseudomonas sp. FP2338]
MKIEPLRSSLLPSFTPATQTQSEISSIEHARPKRASAVVDLETKKAATTLIRAGDAALSSLHSAALMDEVMTNPTGKYLPVKSSVISDIPPVSTFGRAWAQLTHAIQSEPFASFASKHNIDTSTLKINTQSGWVIDCIANGKRASFSRYDAGYEQATAAVTAAARAFNSPPKSSVLYTGANRASTEVIGNFYGVRQDGTQANALRLITEQQHHLTFDSLREPDSKAPEFNPATYSRIRERQREAIDDFAGEIALKPELLSPSQRTPKPSVEDADREMARMYSGALLSLRPEMAAYGKGPRTGFSISEIPEYSTLGQTLRNPRLPSDKDAQISLDWISRFYAEPKPIDLTLVGTLTHASRLTRDGFRALNKINPPTDEHCRAVQELQHAAIQRLENPSTTKPVVPAAPPQTPIAALNPVAAIARRQFAGEPNLYSVVARLLGERIKQAAPSLDVDVNQLAIETPDPDNPGKVKRTQLMALALDHLAGGEAPNFTSTDRAFDTRPDLFAHTGNDPEVPLLLDLSALSTAIGALPDHLNSAYEADSHKYWNELAFSTPTHAASVFPDSRRTLISHILRSNLQLASMKQPGLDEEQRKTVDMVVRHPEGSTRPAPLDRNSSGATVYTLGGSTPNVVIHRYLSQSNRDILLLVEPSGKITPYDSWDDVEKAGHIRVELTDNMFDTQANTLIKQHRGDSLFNPPPTFGPENPPQANTKLPDWMNNADEAQRFVLHELSQGLASFIQRNKGRAYNSGIPDISTFAQEQFDRLPESQKLTRHHAKDLSVTFQMSYGGAANGSTAYGGNHYKNESLTEVLINNLSGLPSGTLEVSKRVKDENGREVTFRVPALEKHGALQQVITDLDIGKTYPALLKEKLLDNPAEMAERRSLFVQQVPIEIQLKALELGIKGEAGFDNTGVRYVQEIFKPGTGPRIVDGKEIVIRPLAFDNKGQGTVDVVEGAYLIEPKDGTDGPVILYRPLISDAPLLQFPNRQALLEAIQKPGKLQDDTLAWLADKNTRKIYSGNGFKHPNFVAFGLNFGSVSLNETIPLAMDNRLEQTLQEGKLMEHLYQANAQNLISLAEQQSTSDAESRWATLKTGGFLLLNAVLPALRGPGAVLGYVLQAGGVINDLEVLSDERSQGKEAALADLLVNMASLLAHFKIRSQPETSTAQSARPVIGSNPLVTDLPGRSLLVDDVAAPTPPSNNRIVLGGRADIKPLAGDIQVFEDTYNGKPRLNIIGHGKKPLDGQPTHIEGEDGKRYGAEDIDLELLARGIDIRDYKDVRLLTCYSASGGEQSLAAKLSARTNVRVKGFEQEIITDYYSVDDEDPFKIYEDASAYYQEHYPNLSVRDVHRLAETELNHRLAGRDIQFNVRKDDGTEIEVNLGSDEKPVIYKTRVDYQPRTFGKPKIKTVPVKPIEVEMGYLHTAEDAHSVLSTRGLTDCSALAVLTDLKDGVYQKRTLMHLTGSHLDFALERRDAYEELQTLNELLANGGKVIFVAGVNSQSTAGLGFILGQEHQGGKPLLDILKKPGVETTIASSVGVEINPDGTFNLIEGTGKGVFNKTMTQEVLDRAR